MPSIYSYKAAIHSYYPSICVNMSPLATHKGRLGEKRPCYLANHSVCCIVVCMCYFNNVPLSGMAQAKISTTILTWYEALNITRHNCDFKKSHSICPDYLLHILTII